MYTSIKKKYYNVFCPYNIISRDNNYIREREILFFFFDYLTLDIEINYSLLKY